MIDGVKSHLDIIGKGIALAALIFSVATYFSGEVASKKRAQFEESENFILRYNAGPRAYEAALRFRLLYYSRDFNLNDADAVPEDTFKAIAVETLFGNGETGDEKISGFAQEINLIADFYSQLKFCIEEGLCDPQLSLSFFCARSERHFKENQRLLHHYRDLFSETNNPWDEGLSTLCS